MTAQHRGRFAEDVGMWAAILVGGASAGVKLWVYLVCSTMKECHTASAGFPWETGALMLLLILPKTVGRASAGKVWEILAGKLGKPDA